MSPLQMRERLMIAFPGDPIEVNDLTGNENHFEVLVESKAFQGLSRIEQHQKVMATFAAELKTGEVHALKIKTLVRS